MLAPNFWDDANSAQIKSQSLSYKKQELSKFENWEKRVNDLIDLESMLSEIEPDEKIKKKFNLITIV
jgi:hypothetical protein